MVNVQELKRRKESQKARNILERVLKQVEPLMKRHSLRLVKLSEFYPRTPNLLGININMGQHIKLRLRRHSNDMDFLDYETILGTMLHELTHNTHAAHDKEFYAQLDKYNDQLEEIMMSGYVINEDLWVGNAFKLSDRLLNQQFKGRSATTDRSLIVQAAEKRRKTYTGGVYKLSDGNSREVSTNPRQKAVEAALERRRLNDEKWCGNVVEILESEDDDEGNDDDSDGILIINDVIVIE